jgi:hypothetical protein
MKLTTILLVFIGFSVSAPAGKKAHGPKAAIEDATKTIDKIAPKHAKVFIDKIAGVLEAVAGGLPDLPVDVPKLPELPVDIPTLPADIPELPELPVEVPELPV